MPVTVTTISKSSVVSVSTVAKSSGADIPQASPMGLLLSLTYASTQSGTGGISVTLIGKS